MRILFATSYKASMVGGISKWAEHIVNYYHSLSQSDFIIDVLPMNRSGFMTAKSKVERWVLGIKEYSTFLHEEKKMLKNNQYDVMHLCTSASYSLFKDLLMLRMAKKKHVSTILHFHFGRIPYLAKQKNWEWKLLCKAIRKASIAVPIDMTSYNTLKNAGFDNIVYLPNPVAPMVLDYAEKNKSVEHRDNRMILYAGHCVRNKGVYELVDACKKIPNIRLVLVGRITDEVKNDLITIANEGEWLQILGERSFDEVLRLMLTCGVFTLPSYSEGFPNVILESMACGCAIVATSVGAIPEMLDIEHNGECGMCVEPRDVKGLQSALTYYIERPEEATLSGCNAQNRVMSKYTMGQIWETMTGIWKQAKSQSR